MNNMVKAANSLTLKKWLEENKPDLVKELEDSLSPEARKVYQSVLAVQWLPADVEKEILRAGARLLFPGDPNALERLGHLLAHQTMTGMYRFFLSTPTLEFVLRRVPNLWSAFFQSGMASLKEVSQGHMHLVVTDFAEMEPYQHQITTGYIRAIAELLGAKNVQVNFNSENPEAWEWEITCEI
jgi:hypothetical protein